MKENEVIIEIEGSYEEVIRTLGVFLYEKDLLTLTTLNLMFGEYTEEGELIKEGISSKQSEDIVLGVMNVNGYKIKQRYNNERDDMGIIYELYKV